MKQPTPNPLATLKDCAKPPRPLKVESLRYWRSLTPQLVAEERLRKSDLEALALCCVALGLLDFDPSIEHMSEARAWLVACGLTPAARIPNAYRRAEGEELGSGRRVSQVTEPGGGLRCR
jgi:phage terminase small subunit